MTFIDTLVFPTEISYGSSGGPQFSSIIQRTPSGRVSVIQRTSEPPSGWSVRWKRQPQYAAAVLSFARITHGAVNGFRFLDWNDYSTNPLHVGLWDAGDSSHRHLIGATDGTTTRFALVKTYTFGARTRTRRIRKPMRLSEAQAMSNLDAVKAIGSEANMHGVWVGGAPQTIGVDFSIDYETGEVVFALAPTAGATVEWAGYFVIPARFGANVDEKLSLIAQNYGESEFDEIDILEIMDATVQTVPERAGRGASTFVEAASATQRVLAIHDGELIRDNPDAAAASPFPIKLPVLATWMLGGGWFRIVNIGAVDSLAVQDSAGAAVVTVPPANTVELWVGKDGSGNPAWVVL